MLISIDTLRADRLGCYGYRNAATPHLDKLASESVLFEQAFTPVPLTLPAHTSLLTGAYPPTHGVHDNGEALAGNFPTLAEHLHSTGFQSAAFVGAFILDRRFGLAKGFDQYEGDFRNDRFEGADPGTVQLRGDQVEAAAEQWMTAHNSRRSFVFIHFYDLHGPYLLPPSWSSRFPGRIYDGELSYVDDLIGRLWITLQRDGLADRTLLVITADHGEGLGEHGESKHGFFLYSATTHIPLIIRFPDGRFAGRRITDAVSLIDIAPTVCSLLGVPLLPSFEGRSLSSAMAGGSLPQAPIYSETLYPYRYFHSSPLYAVRDRRYTYIEAPHQELYDHLRDPTEAQNFLPVNNAVANSMRGDLHTLMGSLARPSVASPVKAEAIEQLRSLGYVSAFIAASGIPNPNPSLPDPKERIGLFRRFLDARDLENEGKYADAVVRLDRILALDPQMFSVEIDAGLSRQHLNQHLLAVDNFKAALRVEPKSALAHYDLGVSLGNLHRDDEAERELDVATVLEPWFSRAFIQKGLIEARQGKLAEAIASLDRAISIDASDFDAFMNRGNIEGILGDWAKAQPDLENAAALEPHSAKAQEALGTLAFHRGDLNEALIRYRTALFLDPQSSSIHSSLGMLYSKLGNLTEARGEFERALALDPSNASSRHALEDLSQRPTR